MQIFLLRHATRNYTMGDVTLNEKGLEQAKLLSQDSAFQSLATILSSPKKRSLMTVEPLALGKGLKPTVIDALDQMRKGETELEFATRVRKVTEQLSSGKWQTPLLVCSHSDWLGVATQVIPCDEPYLKHYMFQCADYLQFQIVNGLWVLKS